MYYNEEYYLYPYYGNNKKSLDDSSFLIMINEMYSKRKSNGIIIDNCITAHKEKIMIYREYIRLIAKLINELGIDKNTISYSLVISLLLKVGLFSDWNRFQYMALRQDSLYGCLGLQVVRGSGSCRHVASFYKDVFDELGLYNDKLYCNYNTDGRSDIANKTKARHVINIINYDGYYLGMDIINDYLFRFVDEFKMESMFKKNKVYIFNKPYMNILAEGLSYDEMIDKLSLYGDNAYSDEIISFNDYMEIVRDTRESILRSEDILLDFNNERKNYIKKMIYK